MSPDERRRALRTLARDLSGIDVEVYAAHDADPLEPVLGGGDPSCRVLIFGRDPGRDEVRWQEPFIGAGGQQVRAVLHQRLHGAPLPDFQASREVGQHAFWLNTVPYKPVGNKAWSMKVRRAFRPVISDLFVHGWHGRDVIALGQNAFTWFGLDDRTTRDQLAAAWSAEPRFEGGPVSADVTAPDGATRTLRIWPMPHPSPLNATWYKRFPEILDQRLAAIGWGPGTTR